MAKTKTIQTDFPFAIRYARVNLPTTVDGTGDFKADGTVPATGDFNMGGNQVSNAGAAVAGGDLTTLAQVQSLIAAIGSGGHVIEDEGTPVTQRPNMNFVGVNVSVADSGGKTVVTVGGPTTAYVDAGDAALLALIPAAGGAPADVTKAAASAGAASGYSRSDHKHDVSTAAPGAVNVGGVAAAEGSATSLARSDHTHSLTGQLPTANIANNACTYAKIQDISAASRLLGRGSAAGSGDPEEITPTGGIEMSGTNLQRSALTGAISAAAGSNTTAFASGDFVALNITTTGFLSVGATPATAGTIRLPNGGSIQNRNNANSANVNLISTNSTDDVIVGQSGGQLFLDSTSAGGVNVRAGGTIRLQVTSSVMAWTVADARFDNAVTSPRFYQNDTTTAGTTGQKLKINAQNATGTGATVGGDLESCSGTGATAGAYTCKLGNTTFLSAHPTNGITITSPTAVCKAAGGTENVEVDLVPSQQYQGTLATANSQTFDVAIATSKRYVITADVWVDDGAGGAALFAKALYTVAHQTGGAAVKVLESTLHDNAGAGFTFSSAISTTNIRYTLSNSSGSTRSYNVVIGIVRLDKP